MANWLRIRLGFSFTLLAFFFGFVGFRLVQLQVLPNSALDDLGKRQYRQVAKKDAFRLPVFDRNHEELAVSSPAGSVYIRPKLIRARKKTARVLAKHLGGSPEKWYLKIKERKPFVWIQRQVSQEVSKKLAEEKLAGVFIETETRRLYPNGTLASQILGFTDVDGNGLSGIELKLNSELLERESRTPILRDGKGMPAYIENSGTESSASIGVQLTLDRRIQSLVEEELALSLQETQAKNVMAVVMDPYTGEIFAMGQRPSFDPNRPNHSHPSAHTNQFISSLYEPGSTMKVLLAAEALQSGLLKKDSLIDCENGKLQFGNKIIREAEADHQFGKISLEKVIEYSSNVGAAKVGQILGADRVRSTMDKFGLTAKTQVGLPGETSGSKKSEDFWKPIFLATASFGQGISVTPLQMTTAFAPFANGGYLVRPKILLRDINLEPGQSHELRRVVSPKTVQTMRDILIRVTESKRGTGTKAQIPGMKVAGKTGTAQKYDAQEGYDAKKYLASFIGFLPADHPQLLVGVFVDEPKGFYYGGQVAGPVFKRIAERSLQILDRRPKQTITQLETTAKERFVVPSPIEIDESAAPEAFPYGPPEAGDVVMPDLKGMSFKEAMQVLIKYENELKVSGDGYLLHQEPQPGFPLKPKTSIVLQFAAND